MKTNISEDLPARKFAPAASAGGGSAADSGGGDMEKKAKQLVYDSKYQVRKQMGPDTRMDPAAVVKAVLDRINKSEYPEPIKARARKIVMGDNQVKEIKEFASHNVARALYSVFVEQPSSIIDEEYIEELKRELSGADQSPEERKYKVRVTDKDTKNSYIRWANRSKINELRANPNIASVEMLDLYGSPEPNESERTKGAQTASVTAGKGLKNNDGNLANNYPPYNAVSRGDIIAGATGKDQMGGKKKVREEFIGEKDNGDKKKPIEPMKGKSNCVTVYDPSGPGSGKDRGVGGIGGLMAHNELEGEVIAETGYSKFLKIVSSSNKKPAKANMNGPQVGCDDPDPRGNNTTDNLVKNKLRLMGLKMSYEPEGDVIDEEMPKKVKGKKLSGTTNFTRRGGPYGRRANEKNDLKSMKPIFPEPRENESPDDGDYDEHPALTPRQRNRRPGYP